MNTTPNNARPAEPVEFAPLGVVSGNKGRSIDIARFALSLWKPMALGLIGGCLMGSGATGISGPTYEAEYAGQGLAEGGAADAEGQARRYGDRGEHVYLIKSDAICQRALKSTSA